MLILLILLIARNKQNFTFISFNAGTVEEFLPKTDKSVASFDRLNSLRKLVFQIPDFQSLHNRV